MQNRSAKKSSLITCLDERFSQKQLSILTKYFTVNSISAQPLCRNLYFFYKSQFLYCPCDHQKADLSKTDIRNPLSLLAHERSRFASCQWELLTPTDVSIPLTHRLVLYALEAGECLFCVHTFLHHYTITFIVSTQKISFTLFLFRMIILSHIFYSQIFCKISFNPFAE